MGVSPQGSSVHGILQTRILEWVAMPSSRGSSQPRDRTCIYCVSCIAGGFFFTIEPLRKPLCGTEQPKKKRKEKLNIYVELYCVSLFLLNIKELLIPQIHVRHLLN